MNSNVGKAFQSIESAHNFVTLLPETITEAKQDVEGDVLRESSAKNSQRLDVLPMALYSLSKLEAYMTKSCRILDDLRCQKSLLSEP
jgi:hypothetical protein